MFWNNKLYKGRTIILKMKTKEIRICSIDMGDELPRSWVVYNIQGDRIEINDILYACRVGKSSEVYNLRGTRVVDAAVFRSRNDKAYWGGSFLDGGVAVGEAEMRRRIKEGGVTDEGVAGGIKPAELILKTEATRRARCIAKGRGCKVVDEAA